MKKGENTALRTNNVGIHCAHHVAPPHLPERYMETGPENRFGTPFWDLHYILMRKLVRSSSFIHHVTRVLLGRTSGNDAAKSRNQRLRHQSFRFFLAQMFLAGMISRLGNRCSIDSRICRPAMTTGARAFNVLSWAPLVYSCLGNEHQVGFCPRRI